MFTYTLVEGNAHGALDQRDSALVCLPPSADDPVVRVPALIHTAFPRTE